MSEEALKELTDAASPSPQGDGFGQQPESRFERAKSVTVETARYVATEFAALDRSERLRLVKAFRVELIPRKAPGRKRQKEITAAYADWKQGAKGLQLYRKHIPGFDKLAQWRRQTKSRALMDAIRTRQRRERRRRTEVGDKETTVVG